ncbi:MAG: tetratricopeptide repeat protein [Peptococcaceae bacterium]|nr:tetratricopeptide repeat protein [Peptococcaceae bacterium]
MKNHYATLNIARDASLAEIKRAYFALVRTYPPDNHPAEFMKIREAYEVLVDDSTRRQYDAVISMPEVVVAYYRAGQEALQAGDHQEAIRLLERVMKFYPHFSVVNSLLGEAYLNNENSGKAIRIFEALVEQEQNNAGFVRQLAHAYAMRGWSKKAINCYRKALTLDEDNLSLWLGLVKCLLEADDQENAMQTALAGIEVSKRKGWDNLPLYAYVIPADISLGNLAGLKEHLAELNKKALENEENKAYIGRFLAGLAQEVPETGCRQELALVLATTAELLPDDGVICQLKDKLLKQNNLALQVSKLLEDPEISPAIADMLESELEMCSEKECLDCEVTQFFYELDIIAQIESFRRKILLLKNNYPALYDMKRDFFDRILNRKQEQYLHDDYRKRFEKYQSLCPERFAGGNDRNDPTPQPYVRPEPKIGRNDPCFCGSGKKYKKCCGM